MLRARYDKFKIEQDQIAFQEKFKQEEEKNNELQNKRAYLLNKSKEYKQHQAELFARIKFEFDYITNFDCYILKSEKSSNEF
jgi:hypothetical protein